LQAAAVMQQGHIIDLSAPIALKAAKLGYELRMPLADSITLATARLFGAVIWTQDVDFKGIARVKYKPKR